MLKSQIQNILTNRLVKSVLVVASGTVGAQVVGMAFVPFITRAYGPEAYGMLGAFIAITGVLSTVATLAYPVAIVLPKEDVEAKALVKISILIATLSSFLILVILLFMGSWLLPKLGASNLIDFMFFIPLVMFLASSQDIAQQWLIRKKAFKGITQVSLIHSVINYGSQALVGIFTPFAIVLISIHTFAIALRATLSGYIGIKVSSKSLSKVNDGLSLKNIAKKYCEFPIYRAPQMLLNAASQSLPILMLTALFGPASAGFYTLTRTALGLPVSLLGTSVQSVFYPYFNDAVVSNQKTFSLLLKATIALAAIGLIPFILIIIFGPIIFKVLFGEEWVIAGQYSQWISIWMYFVLVSRPVISAISVFNMQRWFLFFEVLSSVLRAATIYFGFFILEEPLLVIAAYSILNSLIYISMIFKVMLVSRKSDHLYISS